MTKKEMLKNLKAEHAYSICGKCGKKLGGKCDGVHTYWRGVCDICEEQESCNAITDWVFPKKYGVKYIWD